MNPEGLVLLLITIDVPMKTVYSILLASLFTLLFTSCTKESFDEKIVGKWQIQEVYNGYTNGGNFQWTTVPDLNRSVIEFLENGNFNENKASGSYPNSCSGTYTLINENQVQINSTCNSAPYILSVNLSNKELTITHSVREGEIKEKFIRL